MSTSTKTLTTKSNKANALNSDTVAVNGLVDAITTRLRDTLSASNKDVQTGIIGAMVSEIAELMIAIGELATEVEMIKTLLANATPAKPRAITKKAAAAAAASEDAKTNSSSTTTAAKGDTDGATAAPKPDKIPNINNWFPLHFSQSEEFRQKYTPEDLPDDIRGEYDEVVETDKKLQQDDTESPKLTRERNKVEQEYKKVGKKIYTLLNKDSKKAEKDRQFYEFYKKFSEEHKNAKAEFEENTKKAARPSQKDEDETTPAALDDDDAAAESVAKVTPVTKTTPAAKGKGKATPVAKGKTAPAAKATPAAKGNAKVTDDVEVADKSEEEPVESNDEVVDDTNDDGDD